MLFLDIDRDKAQALGLAMSDVFNTLQATLGGYYVNDFNLYRALVAGQRAGARRRTRSRRSEAVWQHSCAEQAGRDGAAAGDRGRRGSCWGRRRSPATTTDPDDERCLARRGRGMSSGDALVAMEQVSGRALPRGV
jgi:hypothetical protein